MMISLRRFFPSMLAAVLALPAVADTLPDPTTKHDVPPFTLVSARISTRLDLADFKLEGTLRSDKTKKSYPIQMLTKGHVVVYKFLDQPLQIRVTLDPSGFSLQRRSSDTGTWASVPAGELTSPILGTDITYGDLNLNFINWDKQDPLGTDSIKTLPAYVFQATPGPDDHSAFAAVRYWVSKEYWAFLRIDGLNAKGQTVKRVEVQDVMTIADKYTVFKEMKISSMAPDKEDIATSTTYIDIADGKQGSGLDSK